MEYVAPDDLFLDLKRLFTDVSDFMTQCMRTGHMTKAGYSWPAFPIHRGGRKMAFLLPIEPRTVLEPQIYKRVGKS